MHIELPGKIGKMVDDLFQGGVADDLGIGRIGVQDSSVGSCLEIPLYL